MLLKSTGSLRRKRAENSPVWRKGSRGGGTHERAAGYRRGAKIARVHVRTANSRQREVAMVPNATLLTAQARALFKVHNVAFFIRQLDDVEGPRPPKVRTNTLRLPQAPPLLFSLDADAQSPPTFLRPRAVVTQQLSLSPLHFTEAAGPRGDVARCPLIFSTSGRLFFLELNIYRLLKMWLQTDGKNNHFHLCKGPETCRSKETNTVLE